MVKKKQVFSLYLLKSLDVASQSSFGNCGHFKSFSGNNGPFIFPQSGHYVDLCVTKYQGDAADLHYP